MTSPSFLRTLTLLRNRLLSHYHHRPLAAGIIFTRRLRLLCSAAESSRPDEDASASEKTASPLSAKGPLDYVLMDDPDYRKWRVMEAEIFRDIEPTISLVKEILHSERYRDGERLTVQDEEVVVDKLLAYHPHAKDKTGCGIDSIMVDRHPQFKLSRCLFVVRTDGSWIDFSYQKCIRAYIRDKYPTYAERFIREYFKRGSS